MVPYLPVFIEDEICLEKHSIVPWIDYRELRRLLKLEDVLAQMDWRPNQRRGEYLRGSCPLCSTSACSPVESTSDRHFVVHLGRQRFKCFSCQHCGDILDLWSAYRQTNLNSAANELLSLHRQPLYPKSSNHQSEPNQPPK